MVSPKVSIICPVYNAEKYLECCLDSILSQTLKDIEVICINDGSSDGSWKILQKYAKQDNRLKIIDKQNSGAAICRNIGIESAKGEYLQFSDADDILEPDMIEGLYKTAQKTKSDICICQAFRLQKKQLDNMNFALKINYFPSETFSPSEIPDNLFKITNPAAWNKLFSRKFIMQEKIRFQNLSSCNDIAFVWISLATAKKISYSQKGGYIYRSQGDGVIFKLRGRVADNIFLAAKYIKKNLTERNLFEQFKDVFYFSITNCFIYESLHCERGKLKNILQLFERFLPKDNFMRVYKSLKFEMNIFGIKIKIKRHKVDKLLRNIFSITNKDSKKIIRLLGFKIKIKASDNKYKLFLNHTPAPRTILIIEINQFHGEVLLGAADYFRKLGFNVDFLLNSALISEQATQTLPFEHNVFSVNEGTLKKIRGQDIFEKYSAIYINSSSYYKSNQQTFDYLHLPKNIKVLEMHHNVADKEKSTPSNMRIPLVLAEYLLETTLNCHYFGAIDKCQNKNKKTNFIVVGNIEDKRKNFHLLNDAVTSLLSKGIRDFKITVIGKGDFKNYLNDEIKDFFDITGRLSYPSMYEKIAQSDFVLTLLDAQNPEHSRYKSVATSGSYQLIYGFKKPCLIERSFADLHGLNSGNSLIYNENSELVEKMVEAIKMPEEQYQQLRAGIEVYADKLYQKSLHNLKEKLLANASDTELNTYVSLGINCFVRQVLSRRFLKDIKCMGELSLPFDLCVCPIQATLKMLKTDHRHWFDNLKFSSKDKIWHNKHLKISYNHDQDCGRFDKKKLIKRYLGRIENFRLLMQQNYPLCFVMTLIKNDFNTDIINEIYQELCRLRMGKDFKFIVVNIDPELDFDAISLNKNIAYKNIYHPYPKYWGYWWKQEHYNSENGMEFENTFCNYIKSTWQKHMEGKSIPPLIEKNFTSYIKK